MRLIRVVLAAGGFFFLLIVIVLVRRSTSHPPRPSLSRTVSDQTELAPFVLKVGGNTYKGLVTSQIGMAVLQVTTSPVMRSSSGVESANGTFIFVTVGVTNFQNDEITINSSLFEVVDETGNVYSSSWKSMEMKRGAELFLSGIGPGVSKQGIVIFDVPPSIIRERLTLRFRGGMTGSTAVVPLEARKTAPVE
jgi:hypothetical protein